MKLTKNQQAIISSMKANGWHWINPNVTPALYRQYMKLVDKGVLTRMLDGTGIRFNLAA